MFHRVQQYELIAMDGRWFRPRVYGDRQPDGSWDGWLVFFPLDGGPAIASDRETVQRTFDALGLWATGLTRTYLDGALARAIMLAEQPAAIAELPIAEYEALDDAERREDLVAEGAEAEKAR